MPEPPDLRLLELLSHTEVEQFWLSGVLRLVLSHYPQEMALAQNSTGRILTSDSKARIPSESTIDINSCFELRSPHGIHSIEPENLMMISPVFALHHKRVVGISVDNTGSLMVAFEGSYDISVPANDQFEAWMIRVEGEGMLICMPGGVVAMWDEG